jgi:hypothetical protein
MVLGCTSDGIGERTVVLDRLVTSMTLHASSCRHRFPAEIRAMSARLRPDTTYFEINASDVMRGLGQVVDQRRRGGESHAPPLAAGGSAQSRCHMPDPSRDHFVWLR